MMSAVKAVGRELIAAGPSGEWGDDVWCGVV